tara:strand:+ start:3750 stop:3953 length:204 start_codon:yes stop_codon:yes gene_type:complete
MEDEASQRGTQNMALIKKSRKWGTHPTQITKYDIQKQIKERELKEGSLDILNGKPLGKQEEDTNDAK